MKMSSTELHEETSFRLLGLTFTPTMDWKPYIQSIAKAASRKVGSLFRAQRFLSPESILYLYKSTIRPCMEYCSHIWGGAHMSKGLDLLDRVQKRVVNLVGKNFVLVCLLCLTRGMLLASACCISITIVNVLLSLLIWYLPSESLFEALVFLSRCIVIR